MIVIDVKGEIIDGQYGAIMRRYFGDDGTTFSIETVKAALADGESGDEVLLNLDSVGGDIDAALHIYDYLRESGRVIYSNIVGESSSAASIICLAAPRKNRSGSNNASAALHYTSGYVGGKVEDIQAMADEMKHYNSKLAEIYAERTGMSRKRADEILSMDKRHFANDLIAS